MFNSFEVQVMTRIIELLKIITIHEPVTLSHHFAKIIKNESKASERTEFCEQDEG